jgi:SAM-dependent methyltransferase
MQMTFENDRSPVNNSKPDTVTLQIPDSDLVIRDCGTIPIEDRFASPEGRTRIDERVSLTVELAKYYRESKGITAALKDIPRPRQADKENFGTRYWINLDPTFETFLDTAAFATTVDLLYDPDNARFANGQALGDEMREALKNLIDAMEIRARSEIIKQRMSVDVQSGERWLSLACGNAMPIIQSAIASDRNPSLTLVDFNFDNLRHARRLTKSLERQIVLDACLWRDLIDPRGFKKMQIKQFLAPAILKQAPVWSLQNLEPASFDRIEIGGFMEYLPPEMAARFLRSVDELLKHDGLIIFDDLSTAHPQRDFYEGVLQWPLTKFRNTGETGKIIADSGIKVANDAVEVRSTPEKVYPIFEIRKS